MPGQVYAIAANFINASGDVDLLLYREDEAHPVSYSTSASDDEALVYAVPADGGDTYHVQVDLFSGYAQTYDLLIEDRGAIDCFHDFECAMGEVCADKVCIEGCRSWTDCSTGQYCVNYQCVSAECYDHSACDLGEACIDLRCASTS